jgi:hypothetical protein
VGGGGGRSLLLVRGQGVSSCLSEDEDGGGCEKC